MIKVNGPWVRLCVRADALLANHKDKLSESDVTFLSMLSTRKIVWGTEYQVKRINKIENDVQPQLQVGKQ